MSVRAPLTFDQSQEQVEAMMQRGTAFGRVEDAIDAAELSAAHKAALWLLAWSLRDHVQQRQDARLMVAASASTSAVSERPLSGAVPARTLRPRGRGRCGYRSCSAQ